MTKELSNEDISSILKEAVASKKLKKSESNEPPVQTGTCVHCHGVVKSEYVHELIPNVDRRFVPIGPTTNEYYHWVFKGYNCVDCGLMYKFLPKEK